MRNIENSEPLEDFSSPNGMEQPCKCDCGQWFELNEGFGDGGGNVICPSCHRRFRRIDEIKDDIEECKKDISNAEWTLNNSTEELHKLERELEHLTEKKY